MQSFIFNYESKEFIQVASLNPHGVMMNPDDLVSYWTEQNKLMWSRMQTTAFIEAGTLTGWYKVCGDGHPALGAAILLLGYGLLVIVSLLIRRDSQYLDACSIAIADIMPTRLRPPLFGILGRHIAIALPLLLAIINVVLVFTAKYFV
ncbi:MAG: hypothetical protein HY886_08890 [Deltaproteobacteria bacterium]|nr:hypothetical protein [Deltaproteobacteria bacterium]